MVESAVRRFGCRRTRLPTGSAVNTAHVSRVGSGGQCAQQARESRVSLPADGEIDALGGTGEFQAHLAVEARSAEDRHQIRVQSLQPTGQRERRGVLLERAAKPDYPHLVPRIRVDQRVEQRGDVEVADPPQPVLYLGPGPGQVRQFAGALV